MAAAFGASVSAFARAANPRTETAAFPSLKSVSMPTFKNGFPSLRLQPASRTLRISCAAKTDTADKVVEIVVRQLAIKEKDTVNAETKLSQLGADSLDIVEIVMGFEEEFGVTIEEESARGISTVQDAANLIDELVEKKNATAEA